MPRTGRPPKPTDLKVIQGTFRTNRHNSAEPSTEPLSLLPPPPDHLDGYAIQKWNQVGPVLCAMRVLSESSLSALEMLCESYGEYRELKDEIHRGGDGRRRTLAEYFAGRNSQTQPEYAAMKEARATYRVLLQDFGMTPASKSRVSVVEAEKPTGFKSRMKERHG